MAQDPGSTQPESPDSEQTTSANESAGNGPLTIDDISALMPEPLQPYWEWLVSHPSVGAVFIIVAGFVIARIFVTVLRRAVSQLTKRTQTDIDDKLLSYLSRPVFLTIFYGALCVATISLRLPESFSTIVVRLLLSLTVLMWMSAAFPVCGLLLETLGRFRNRFEIVQERTIPMFNMISKLLIVGITGYVLLQIWNVDATAWLASAGVVGIAVGFAARDTLANLFSGVFIVVDSPYKIGDYVNLDSGERGMITHVGLRSTRLLTRDDIEVTLPNAVIANEKIVNESAGRWPKRRIRIKVGVAYDSDLEQVVDVLMGIADNNPDVARTPAARVRFRELADSSCNFELLCWIAEPELRGKVTHDLLMAVHKRFREEAIEIPYPKQDLYLKEQPKPAD